jgi:RNA polymerase sigma-70 factor, ECF subfamily
VIARPSKANSPWMHAGQAALLDEPPRSAVVAPRSDLARQQAMAAAHYQLIWRSLRRMGVGPQTVDDAAQQVFVLAAEKIAQIEVGKERAFLFQTAVRVAWAFRRDFARKREDMLGEGQEGIEDASPLPDALAVERQRRALLDELLDALAIDLRAVFILFEIEGLGTPEIASLLGIPAGTAASRLRRARATFREAAARACKRLERKRTP